MPGRIGGDGKDVSRRTERVASVIRDVIAEGIRTQLSDPRLDPWTSVTRVQVSPDLAVAHVNVSVMSENPARRRLCVQALQAAAGRLRTLLARRLTARQTPRLEFHLDDSVQQSLRTIDTIDRVLGQSARPPDGEHEPQRPAPGPEQPGGDVSPEAE
jgi:ribosome-binding factor A